MIKKILLFVLVLILAFGVWSAFSSGISLKVPFTGKLVQTNSYTTLLESSKKLAEDKVNLQRLNDQDFPAEQRKLEIQKNNFKNKKKAYEDLATQASVEEIRAVNQTKEYLLDYLWMKIGTYANDDDVKVLINPDYERARIDFDVSGPYVAVINFIYDLEKDDDLSLTINNIVMQGGSSDVVTRAKFFVTNINVITSESKAAG